MSELDELARTISLALGDVTGICDTSHAEDLEIADAILAAGYRKPRTITTAEELDALPDDTLLLASGSYITEGTFTHCWVRPVPEYITGPDGPRAWETLIYGDSGWHNMTTADRIKLPATVLWEPQP